MEVASRIIVEDHHHGEDALKVPPSMPETQNVCTIINV